MRGLLIAGGRIVDPEASLDSLRDLRLREGRVVEIGEHLEPEPGEARFRRSRLQPPSPPGFVDIHVHLRTPGFPEKETIATGTEAAVRGGFTSIACMPNTRPAIDDPRVLSELMESVEREGRCRVYPIAAITRGREGLHACDFAALAQAGAVAFSDDGDTLEDERLLRDAALAARDLRAPFIEHCEPEERIVARDLAMMPARRKNAGISHICRPRVRWSGFVPRARTALRSPVK